MVPIKLVNCKYGDKCRVGAIKGDTVMGGSVKFLSTVSLLLSLVAYASAGVLAGLPLSFTNNIASEFEISIPVPRAPESPFSENADRLAEFKFITSKLESVYSHLESKQKNYNFSYEALKVQYQERVQRTVSDNDYQATLYTFFKFFHDPHLWIRFDSKSQLRSATGPAVVNTLTDDMVLITKITRLSGDGVEIRNKLEESLKLAKNAKALIIDLRGNGGGNDSLAYDYVSKLVAHEIPQGMYSVRISSESIAKFGNLPAYPTRPGFSEWKPLVLTPQTKESFKGPIGVLIDGGKIIE